MAFRQLHCLPTWTCAQTAVRTPTASQQHLTLSHLSDSYKTVVGVGNGAKRGQQPNEADATAREEVGRFSPP